jgi:transposase-like protein
MRARRFAMMSDDQKSKVAELKSAIAAAATTTEGVPREVRVAAVSLKVELRQTGTTARELARELGVHESTLCRWERDVGGIVVDHGKRGVGAAPKSRGRAAPFRMVEVTAATATLTTPRSAVSSVKLAAGGLRVAHAPSGLVVDGLDVETLAALLRRMS